MLLGVGIEILKARLSDSLPTACRSYADLSRHACWLFTYWLCTNPLKLYATPQSILSFIRVDLVFLFLLRYRTLTKTPSFHGFMHSPLAEFNTCKRDFLVCNSVYLCEIWSSLFQHLYFGLIRKNCETSDRAIWGKINKILTFSDVTSQ